MAPLVVGAHPAWALVAAIAGFMAGACGAPDSSARAGPPVDPHQTAPVMLVFERHFTPPSDEIRAYASEFRGVESFAEALPQGTEVVMLIDYDDAMACIPGMDVYETVACKSEWLRPPLDFFRRAVVVREKDRERVLMRDELPSLIGPIDTPAKAALLARLQDPPAARCVDFARNGLACAAGSSENSVPVRAVPGGFEVPTFGVQQICGGPDVNIGRQPTTLRILKVEQNGTVMSADGPVRDWVRTAATKAGMRCVHVREGDR